MSSRTPLILLAVGLFAIGTDGYVIAGLLPDLGRDLGVTDSTAGLLVTVFALAYAVGAPMLGVLTSSVARPGAWPPWPRASAWPPRSASRSAPWPAGPSAGGRPSSRSPRSVPSPPSGW
ncbi:MFS transporter [Nonomuraea antimicrobica]